MLPLTLFGKLKIWSISKVYAKAFDYMDHNKLWKILIEMGIPDHLTSSWEICMQVRKHQFKLDMENKLVANQEKSKSRLYIVTPLI